jgi:hypothetical protein
MTREESVTEKSCPESSPMTTLDDQGKILPDKMALNVQKLMAGPGLVLDKRHSQASPRLNP